MTVFLTILGALFVVYSFFQVVLFIVGLGEKHSFMFENMYYENEDGFLELEPFGLGFLSFFPGYVLTVKLKEKGYIREWAGKHAEKSKYSNKFASDALRKVYDEAFKESRKQYIVSKAKKDVRDSRRPKVFNSSFENALYQDAYLKAITNDESVENTVQRRFDALYEDEVLQPVSNDVFRQVIRKSA